MTYDSNAYQQMELAAMYAEAFNEVEAAKQKDVGEPSMDDVVTVPAYKCQKPKGKREENLSSLPVPDAGCTADGVSQMRSKLPNPPEHLKNRYVKRQLMKLSDRYL